METPAPEQIITQETLESNLAAVKKRSQVACERAGREPNSVRLLPVSKTKSERVLRMAYAAGVREFGENRVQEAQQKAEEMADLPDTQWNVNRHIPTNKAKYDAHFAHEYQALDNPRVTDALARPIQKAGRSLDVFLQVHTSKDPQTCPLPTK